MPKYKPPTAMRPLILAIESSCDDTSAAVISNGKILANIVANQAVHIAYGGVVPELASRAHVDQIVPVIDAALKEAKIEMKDLDAIAFTQGPGLAGSLMVGVSYAKAIALALNKPLIAVNHMQAHVLAHFIDEPKPKFPFLCLTVSGGHTQIVLIEDYLKMSVIGQTIDDAAGEAFDKAAKIIGMEYPGGPLIDKFAKDGNPERFEFPFPKTKALDFSFSGLKTSFLYFIQDETAKNENFVEENKADICASIQYRINSILLSKVRKAAKMLKINQIAIAGGVSANSGLRTLFTEAGAKYGWEVYIPRFQYCTDNAAMIAITAHYKYLKGDFASLDCEPNARMKLA